MDSSLRPQAKQFLMGIPVFGGIPDATMERLLDRMQIAGHVADSVVFNEGELAREMFVVRAGSVEVHKVSKDGKRMTTLAMLHEGDCFGEMALIDVQPRSATVIAREPTELYVLTNMDLLALYEEDLVGYSFLLQNICREVSRRLRKADKVIADFFLRLEEYVRLTVD